MCEQRRKLAALAAKVCAGLLAGVAAWSGAAAQNRQEGKIRIAAASDLKFAMAELAQRFKKEHGGKVEVTYGSSGNFFSQIQNGAPFDVFFSADSEYPQKLAAAGAADASTLHRYAVGRIVIWTPPDANVDVARDGWKALLDARVKKIAIANPEHAPYGRVAVAAMQKAGIYERVKPKLVYGENISQAAQFVQSGSAQAGVVALSLAVSPAMKEGQSWLIPAEMHPAIEQAAIVLRGARNKSGAVEFLKFVTSAAGRQILARFGFQPPADGGPRQKEMESNVR